ncbi:MAG TPA: hypothetical protein VJX67_07730, partial [Blastocatellia bacterium]|nr:hypothetical protein [Blastocatellia bacterium]
TGRIAIRPVKLRVAPPPNSTRSAALSSISSLPFGLEDTGLRQRQRRSGQALSLPGCSIAGVLSVALIANFVPALSAARIDPMAALHFE